ncbi:MAG: amidase [Rhodobacteraceae bacterium]|nr:amidase [Paracoccaceae bacterium]
MSDTPVFTGPEICAKHAHEVVDLLCKGEVSPAEVLAASFARIEEVEPAVNAMPTTCRDRAEAMIEVMDGDERRPREWLGGLPIGIKDLTEVEGVRTTFGSLGLTDNIPVKSDELVLRLEDRGGVVVGKTNSPEMGAGGNTFNAVFGMTRNPWDTRKNAGGSSGGAAVSLATGEVWLSQGSDLAGSLRTPAAYCGVVGFRPSAGVAGGGPADMKFHTEAVSGPMARSVRDCALFLDAMAGFDPATPLSWPAPEKSYQQSVLEVDQNVRIAYAPDLNWFTFVSKEMDAHLRGALAKVAQQGGTVDLDCPELPNLDQTYRTLRAMLWAAGPGRAPESVQKHFKFTLMNNIEQGRNLSADQIYDAFAGKSVLFDNMASFLQDFDVLACPVVGLVSGPVEEEYPQYIDGEKLTDYLDWLKYSFLSTTVGLPSVSVPVGLLNGMPVGLQLIGQPRGEARLLQVARTVEIAVGGLLGPIDPVVKH